MWPKWLLCSALLSFMFKDAESILCHRCFSAMGGCGDDVNWRMFPWRDCGDSNYCVKVYTKVGSEYQYIRECETELMKSTRHRLQMPVLRRHGYCLPSRVNNPRNPLQTTDSSTMYCFCNEYNGCNGASGIQFNALLGLILSAFTVFLWRNNL